MTTTYRTDHRTVSDGDVGSDAAARFAREHPGLVKLGRLGWAAKGVVYMLTGLLALTIAISVDGGSDSGGGDEASQSGAIAQIAESTGGALLLYVIAAGLVLYSVWRIISALLPSDTSASSWLNRIGYLVSAATYLLLAFTAFSFARYSGSGQESEDSRIESLTADLLGRSYGQQLVFVVGAVLLVVAAVFAWKAWSASFEDQLAPGGVGPISHRTLITMGRIGWAGRTMMMGLIGFFICRAAVRFNPDDAQGLDGSLRKVATTDVGMLLVLAVAVGLFVYGAFCLISAPRRLLVAADK